MVHFFVCKHCGFKADSLVEEVEHMSEAHPEIIEERMIKAGFVRDPQTGEWIDRLSADEN
jgi:hypothetical protein